MYLMQYDSYKAYKNPTGKSIALNNATNTTLSNLKTPSNQLIAIVMRKIIKISFLVFIIKIFISSVQSSLKY
jgi:hypothetical protein